MMTFTTTSTSAFTIKVKEEPQDEEVGVSKVKQLSWVNRLLLIAIPLQALHVKEEPQEDDIHEDAVVADMLERELEEYQRRAEGIGQPNEEDNDRLIVNAIDSLTTLTQNLKSQRRRRELQGVNDEKRCKAFKAEIYAKNIRIAELEAQLAKVTEQKTAAENRILQQGKMKEKKKYYSWLEHRRIHDMVAEYEVSKNLESIPTKTSF